MPFTFSHPAAVLPLRYLPERYISMTGLVIGSTVPDFEYFLRLKVDSEFSHTWSGLFWFDLPLTIILAFIFHGMVRNSLIDNLPLFVKDRFVAFKDFNWPKHFKQHLWVVLACIIIGVATHILWDDCTHVHGLFVKDSHTMRSYVKILDMKVPLYKILQHVSTVIGGCVVIYAVLKMPKQEISRNQKSIFLYWTLVVSIALALVIIRILTGINAHLVDSLIVTAIAGWLLGLVLTPKLMDVV